MGLFTCSRFTVFIRSLDSLRPVAWQAAATSFRALQRWPQGSGDPPPRWLVLFGDEFLSCVSASEIGRTRWFYTGSQRPGDCSPRHIFAPDRIRRRPASPCRSRRKPARLRPNATRRGSALFKAVLLARRSLFGLRLAGGPPAEYPACRLLLLAASLIVSYRLAHICSAPLGFSGGHVFPDPGPTSSRCADQGHGVRTSHVSAAGLRRGDWRPGGLRDRPATFAALRFPPLCAASP